MFNIITYKTWPHLYSMLRFKHPAHTMFLYPKADIQVPECLLEFLHGLDPMHVEDAELFIRNCNAEQLLAFMRLSYAPFTLLAFSNHWNVTGAHEAMRIFDGAIPEMLNPGGIPPKGRVQE